MLRLIHVFRCNVHIPAAELDYSVPRCLCPDNMCSCGAGRSAGCEVTSSTKPASSSNGSRRKAARRGGHGVMARVTHRARPKKGKKHRWVVLACTRTHPEPRAY